MKSKRSIQKEAIIEYLMSTNAHPTADNIYTEVRKRIPAISLGTVYRNLRKMTERGEILRISRGENGDRFDGNTKPHYHFICMKCGQVFDMNLPYIDKLDSITDALSEDEICKHSIIFEGVCKECKNK